jgi:hypothetical protein
MEKEKVENPEPTEESEIKAEQESSVEDGELDPEGSREVILQPHSFELEIDGKRITVECKKKTVRFPERIVKETGGVTGYDRYILEDENLREPLMVLLGNGIELPVEEIGSREFWEHLYQKNEDGHMELSNEGKLINSKIKEIISALALKISDGDFPNKTFNHVVSGVWPGVPGASEISRREGMILQPIFHPNSMLKSIEWREKMGRISERENTKESFAPMGNSPYMYAMMKKNPGGLYDYVSDGDIDQIEKQEYVHMLRLLKHGGHLHRIPNTIGYGRPHTLEDWREGLRELTNFLDEHPNYFLVSYGGQGADNSYIGLATIEGRSQRHNWAPSTDISLNGAMLGFNEDNEAFLRYIDMIEKKFINQKSFGELAYGLRDIKKIKHEPYGEYYNLPDYRGNEAGIPIVINNPDIPELRWCHAQYAVIPTKGRMNFLRMTSE